MASLRVALITVLPLTGLVLFPPFLRAGIPDGVAIVLGFHVTPVEEDGAIPLPGTPEEIRSNAVEPGLYDVWVFLHTRAPLIGAWSISFGLDYDPVDGSGVDVLGWEPFTDQFLPHPGWPAAGGGFFARWHRFRCLDYRRYLHEGEAGWWIQPVLRLRVRVHGLDVIRVTNPEPGVSPQMIECQDEEWDFDGSHGGVRVIPAVFGLPGPAARNTDPAPARPLTWGRLKARHREAP